MDATIFAELTRRHHRELHVYCYRMLGSFEAAEDHVQEVFLRAWRSRYAFEQRSSARTWLYRIATNACLDTLRRTTPPLQPYPVLPTAANRQPAIAGYVLGAGDSAFRPFVLAVLSAEAGRLTAVDAFEEPGLFAAFGLPATIDVG